MENETITFSQNIKYLRKKYNLKQDDLAMKLNITSQGVSKWETGKSLPDISTLRDISSLFHVSI